MARSFVIASSQFMSVETAAITAAPFTMSVLFYPTTTASNQCMIGCYNAQALGDVQYFDMQFRTNQQIRIRHRDGTLLNVNTSATASLNAWHQAGYVAVSNSDRTVYLDGGNAVNDTTSKSTPSGIARTALAAEADALTAPPASLFFEGYLAEGAIWDTDLTAAEMAILGRFVSPLFVRPQNLVAYWPLIGRYSPEKDLVGGLNLTLTNTPGTADHPRVWYPVSGILGVPSAAAAAANVKRRMMMGMGR
jgi:hypothetical protein